MCEKLLCEISFTVTSLSYATKNIRSIIYTYIFFL